MCDRTPRSKRRSSPASPRFRGLKRFFIILLFFPSLSRVPKTFPRKGPRRPKESKEGALTGLLRPEGTGSGAEGSGTWSGTPWVCHSSSSACAQCLHCRNAFSHACKGKKVEHTWPFFDSSEDLPILPLVQTFRVACYCGHHDLGEGYEGQAVEGQVPRDSNPRVGHFSWMKPIFLILPEGFLLPVKATSTTSVSGRRHITCSMFIGPGGAVQASRRSWMSCPQARVHPWRWSSGRVDHLMTGEKKHTLLGEDEHLSIDLLFSVLQIYIYIYSYIYIHAFSSSEMSFC